ncbi:MAG: NUDIX domain-containing protein [Thermoplasmata archaeon]
MASEPPPSIDQECVEGYVFHRPPLQILLFRRPPDRGNIWAPVSGKVEATDSDYPSALRRELLEETGFDQVNRVFPLDWEVIFPMEGQRWRLHAFGVELHKVSVPTLSSEHAEFAWLSADDASRRLHYPDNREALARLLAFLDREGPPKAPPTV